jgi:hypothetical protein
MAITPSDINNDYTISFLSGSIAREDRILSKTVPGGASGSKTITFDGNFGMGSFGTTYNAVLRIHDGSTTVNYSSEDAEGGNSGNATKIGVGSDRDARDVVTELVDKINASALGLTATSNGGSASGASLTLAPNAGETITITEDPGSVNSGNFGGSTGFTVISNVSSPPTTTKYKATPFRFSSHGVFNIRGQSPTNVYKSFVGEQKS